MSRLESVRVPYSRFKEDIVKKLVEEGYLASYSKEGEKKAVLICNLLYKDSYPAIEDVKLYSKPGRKWYARALDIKPVKSGIGIGLVSTSKGLLTTKEAKKENIGGELLFEVW